MKFPQVYLLFENTHTGSKYEGDSALINTVSALCMPHHERFFRLNRGWGMSLAEIKREFNISAQTSSRACVQISRRFLHPLRKQGIEISYKTTKNVVDEWTEMEKENRHKKGYPVEPQKIRDSLEHLLQSEGFMPLDVDVSHEV